MKVMPDIALSASRSPAMVVLLPLALLGSVLCSAYLVACTSTDAPAWRAVQPGGGNYVVTMPGVTKTWKETRSLGGLVTPVNKLASVAGGHEYVVVWFELPESMLTLPEADSMTVFLKGEVAGFQGAEGLKMSPLKHRGRLGHEAQFSFQAGKQKRLSQLKLRAYRDGPRFYEFGVSGPSASWDESAAKRFFNSIEFFGAAGAKPPVKP